MTKQTDFAYHLTNYLTAYLPRVKNFSVNTIRSYRDTFKLLMLYCAEELHIPTRKLKIQTFSPQLVYEFTGWLKEKRGNSIATANQRLAAIHAFFRYLQGREPQYLFQCQQILAIELAKDTKSMIEYLSVEDLQLIFKQVNESVCWGRRDAALLHLLYDSAARVQELCDLRVRDVYLDNNPHVLLHGKGDKSRYVPIVTDVARRITKYLAENGLDRRECRDMPLFFNQQRQRLTRAGVSYVVTKYANPARCLSSCMPLKITPHVFRHTKAMHLCQAGVDIIYIRDILGHVDLATTEIYARLNIELLRDALENAYPELPSYGLPDWKDNDSLMCMLNSL